MSENYSQLAEELTKKIIKEEKENFIEPISTIENRITQLNNMTYKELSEIDKDINKEFLKTAYNECIQEGKSPADAKKASMNILRLKLDKDKDAFLKELDIWKQNITDKYKAILEIDVNKMNSILSKWNIKKDIKSSLSEHAAKELAEVYVKAYNCLGYKRIKMSDIMCYYPSVQETENNTLEVEIQENAHTRYYDTEINGNIKIDNNGFVLTSTEYTNCINVDNPSQISEVDEDERKEAELLNNISPKDFRDRMFTSVIAEQEIIDRCLITYCNYTKQGESVAGVQVKYEGTDAINKLSEVCNNLFTSDTFHKILGKTSPFLVSDFVNYSDVLIKRIKTAAL